MNTASRILAIGGIALLATGCLWENRAKTETANLKAIVSPSSIGEIVGYVKDTEKDNQRVKMTGSSTSFSDVAVTGDNQYLMNPDHLNKPLGLPANQLKAGVDSTKLARVMSGMKIAQVNTHLESLGLGLPNVGGWDGQTLAGVMMTATHGSGLDYKPMESFIVSMQIVVDGGRVLQVEPTNGITDPAKFVNHVPEDSSVPMELIQDDDTFNAMKVSLGSMGIVYSLTVEAVDFFWVKERREIKNWSEITAPDGFLEKVTTGRQDELRHPDHPEWGKPDFYEFQVNPYDVDGKDDHDVLLTMRWKIDPTLPENQNLKAPATRGQFGNEFSSFLTTQFELIISAVVDGSPQIIPGFIDNILKLQSEGDKVYQNKSYKVFNIGVVNNTEALGIELSGDVANTQAYIEKTMDLLNGYFDNQKRVVTVPLAVRFVQESDALIAMQNFDNTERTDSVHLEFINLQDISYSEEIMIDIQRELMNEGMRPHWGLTLAKDPTVRNEQHIIDRYGSNWTKWKTIMRQYNSNGTFDGRFTDRVGISN